MPEMRPIPDTTQNRRAEMNKPTVVEIPTNASDQVVRLLMEDVVKAIKHARSGRKDRVVVTIKQGE